MAWAKELASSLHAFEDCPSPRALVGLEPGTIITEYSYLYDTEVWKQCNVFISAIPEILEVERNCAISREDSCHERERGIHCKPVVACQIRDTSSTIVGLYTLLVSSCAVMPLNQISVREL